MLIPYKNVIALYLLPLAYSKSHSLFANRLGLFGRIARLSHCTSQSDTSNLHQDERQTRRETVSCHHRNGDMRVVGHPPPGFTRSSVTQVSQRLRPCSWRGTDCINTQSRFWS